MKQFVYLIAVENGMLSVVRNENGYSLPGGECNGSLTHEQQLAKNCLEHHGQDIEVWDYVCDEQTSDGTECYYNGIFTESLAECHVPVEQLPLTQINRLSSPAQRRAAEECLNMMRADAHGSDDEDL